MIDLDAKGAEHLRLTSKLVAEEALSRGWKVEQYHPGGAHLQLTRADGVVVQIHSATPPTTSYVAASRANDKYATHVLLEENGFPVPLTRVIQGGADDMTTVVNSFLNEGKRCVVKPLDSGHGNGVTVGLDESSKVLEAISYAGQYSNVILVQEYIDQAVDVRITCIDYRAVAAVVRIPARVRGDGKRNIAELIDATNASGERGENYRRPLNVIPRRLAERYLAEYIHEVPAEGEWVQVLGTANVGTGGETQDITRDLPDWLKSMAQDAARAAELPVCGVDILAKAMPIINASVQDVRPVIVELNKCPSLFLHEKPIHGEPLPVVKMYVDYLATL